MLADQVADAIIIDEQGTPNARRWRESIASLGDDLGSLREYAASRLIGLDERRGSVEISGCAHAGTLLLPSGRRVRLETKIPGIRLLEWLAYIERWPDFHRWTRQMGVDQGTKFPQVLLQLFIDELDLVTRVHLRKGFKPVDIESPQASGQIRMSELSRRPWQLPRLPRTVRARTFDTDANMVLALAIDAIVLHQRDLSEDHRRRFSHLRDLWAGVSRSAADLFSLVNTAQTNPTHGYGRALQMARVILLGAMLDPRRGVGGNVFTTSLASLWQSGLERMFAELQNQTGWRVIPASQRIRHWDDSTCESSRFMIADLILEKDGVRWVLDAKYKCDFGNEGRNDRFQVCAYALAFDADRVALVYPEAVAHEKRILQVQFGNRLVSIGSFSLPMSEGPAVCRVQLRKLVSGTSQRLKAPKRCSGSLWMTR